MKTTINRKKLSIQYSALALAISFSASNAQAFTFQLGEIDGQFDSSLSVGVSWAMRNPDPNLVTVINGGKAPAGDDDGRLNFKKGDAFSKIFKGVHDLELKYGDSGVFLRGKYWYDFALKDDSHPFKDIDDHGREEGAKSAGGEFLDAFIYHNYSIAEQPGSVRFGKQVVSWGESTFIFNSINSINPADISSFRRPGAEIKEGLIPVNMFYVSQSLTENLAAEAFYQLDWQDTVLDNCGTFFGTDTAAPGCTKNLPYGTSQAEVDLLKNNASLLHVEVGPEGMIIPRENDHDARDSGQWGLALRWLGDGTEYGAYFMNYHSRTPIYSTHTASADAVRYALSLIGKEPPGIPLGQASAASVLGNGHYYMDYPEDIQLYGASFATTLPTGTAWSGEVSYRPNMPLQINTSDLTGKLAYNITNAYINSGFSTDAAVAQADQYITSYKRKEVTQIQTTLTHFFDNVLAANRLTVVGEAGLTHIGGLEKRSDVRYGRASFFSNDGDNGFYTDNSWGYRARAILEYNNLIPGITLKPSMAWSHDVDGYGPSFNEGSKAISVGVDAEYLNTYTASLSYTDYFGGDYNALTDRDFLSLSFGVNF